MHFIKAVAIGATALFTTALAAGQLAFTSTPSSVTAGQPYKITYDSPDAQDSVTITLRKGDPNDLQTVTVLTSSATGGSYTWIPSKSLADATDYALQITQGNQINYSGQISLSGGSASAASSASSSSAAASSSAASYSSSILHTSANATITGGGSSRGTGMPMTRNTTMSSATLHSTTHVVTVTPTASTSGAGFQTSSGSGPSSTSNAAVSSHVFTGSSPLALVLCAIAAIVY